MSKSESKVIADRLSSPCRKRRTHGTSSHLPGPCGHTHKAALRQEPQSPPRWEPPAGGMVRTQSKNASTPQPAGLSRVAGDFRSRTSPCGKCLSWPACLSVLSLIFHQRPGPVTSPGESTSKSRENHTSPRQVGWRRPCFPVQGPPGQRVRSGPADGVQAPGPCRTVATASKPHPRAHAMVKGKAGWSRASNSL